jgi:glycosyltransferase involved in cell wall biosynthesis
MNIAVFIKRTTFHKDYGGLETQNRSLCEGLSQRGHNVMVFSPQRDRDDEETADNGVKYIFVPSEYRMFFSSKKNSWFTKSLLYFQKFHNENKFDIVLSQSTAGLGIIKNKELLNIKIISVVHGSIISELRTRYKNIYSIKSLIKLIPDTAYAILNFFTKQRELIHGSDKIIAVSNFVKNSLLEETYSSNDKFVVINNGIDPTKIHVKDETEEKENEGEGQNDDKNQNYGALQNDGKRLLYVGQVTKEKGVDQLLELFDDNDTNILNDFVLDVVGDGIIKDKLAKKAISLGIDDKFILHGKKNFDELISFYTSPSTKVFLFPTRRFEGFPMVLVEAMLAGLPIVAFNLGGVPDAVEDGKNGYLIPENDIDEFKNKLSELLNEKDKRRSFGLYSYQKAIKTLTLDKMIDSYNKVIDEVLE